MSQVLHCGGLSYPEVEENLSEQLLHLDAELDAEWEFGASVNCHRRQVTGRKKEPLSLRQPICSSITAVNSNETTKAM